MFCAVCFARETTNLSSESGGSSHARAVRWPTLNTTEAHCFLQKIETQSHQDKIAGSFLYFCTSFFCGGFSVGRSGLHDFCSPSIVCCFVALGTKKSTKNNYTNTNEYELLGSSVYCLRLEEVSTLKRLL